uniref:BTB domain-containing protein n=1 Tax=Ditylenchus dipsaci TaxID=166011 RepID=A0A915DG47_9BILA
MAPRTTRKRPADTSCDNLIPSKMNTAEASQMTSAEAKQLGDQLKELETRIDQKFVGIDGSIQLIGGSILDNGDSIQEVKDGLDSIRGTALTSKGSRQGYLRASFNIKILPRLVIREYQDCRVYLLLLCHECERDSDALIYDVEYTIRFLGTTNPRYHSAKQCFDEKCSCSGWASFILWSELIDKTKGFIDENGNFTMHVQFLWDVRMNIQVPLRLDYSASNFLEPDCTLVIEGQKIPVCKALMMIHSAYFKTMFSREFREKNQDNIELKEMILPKMSMVKMWSACCAWPIFSK